MLHEFMSNIGLPLKLPFFLLEVTNFASNFKEKIWESIWKRTSWLFNEFKDVTNFFPRFCEITSLWKRPMNKNFSRTQRNSRSPEISMMNRNPNFVSQFLRYFASDFASRERFELCITIIRRCTKTMPVCQNCLFWFCSIFNIKTVIALAGSTRCA